MRQWVAGAGGVVVATDVWLLVQLADVELPAPHGWKLHVSARPLNFAAVVDRLVPYLLEQRVVFKLARSCQVLLRINSGIEFPAAVGKAFTIYPSTERVTELGHALTRLLDGVQGPRVPSDRQVSPNAPVYYRYGPFRPSWQVAHDGGLIADLHGPDGETFAGLATPFYRQPEWATDPFQVAGKPAATEQQPVLGGRYRITSGVQHHVRGSVFRAERLPDRASVIVKQANAYVGDDEQHFDARLRLRNERRILTMLAGIDGVPAFLDHLRSGQNELLVITDQGPTNLVQEVSDLGCYPASGGHRSVDTLAVRLARIVATVHGRGVLIRDISPKNIVLRPDGASIVDFGIAAADGIAPIGHTPGYSAPDQQRGEPPTAAHDCYALGMSLLFALTGVNPISVEDRLGSARIRALELLELHAGSACDRVVAAIADLLSADSAVAVAALDRLASRPPRWHPAPASPLPRTPAVDADLAGRITEFLVDQLVAQARQILTDPESRTGRVDAGVQRGISGLGLQLLHHLDHSGVAEAVGELVELITMAPVAASPDSLFLGSTGTRIFLTAAARLGIDSGNQNGWWPTEAPVDPAGSDLMAGAAGIGLGELRLFQLSGNPHALEQARAMARRLLDPSAFSAETGASPSRIGVDPAAGLAHGRAGAGYLLTALSAVDESFRPAAYQQARALAAEVPRLITWARQPNARPLAASWCQGLTGVARAMHFCGEALGMAELTRAAIEASDACLEWVPRLAVIGQCCGLAGVGSMLLNLALTRRAADLPDGLELVAGQLLRRSSGPADRPTFPARFGSHDPSWGYGTAGVLAFYRGIRDDTAGSTLESDAYSALLLTPLVR